MEYVVGNEREFWDFLDSIDKEKDKVAILTHIDLDGVASGIFLEEILKAKGIGVGEIFFLDLKSGVFDKPFEKLQKENFSKIFILDINEGVDIKGFQKLKDNFDVFLIDHHPSGKYLPKEKVIKTESGDCSAFAIYSLMDEELKKEWEWLAEAAIIFDYSFKKKENLEFLKKKYLDITEGTVFESEPGKLGAKMADSIIYFKGNLKKAYDLIVKKDFDSLGKYSEDVAKEIKLGVDLCEKEMRYYPEKNLYLWEVKTPFKFAILSVVGCFVSEKNKDATFVVISRLGNGDLIKISARNQNGTRDMNQLLNKAVKGFEEATAGGHVKASGGTFLSKDLEKFKQNILNA